MGQWSRLQYSLVGTLVNGAQAVLFTQIFQDRLVVMATGEYSGPFTQHILTLEAFWLAEIVILQFALFAYLLYGPVREQQVREVVPRR